MIKKSNIGVIGLKGLPAFGGAAAVGENIIDNLKNEYDFTVYSTSSHTDYKTGELNGFKQIVFKKIPFKKLNTLYYYILSTIHALLFSNYDSIHLHHRDAAFIIPILKLRYKVIITTHNSFFVRDKWKKYKWFFSLNERYFVKYADIKTCVSLQEKRDYKEEVGIDMRYIPNGVSKSYISRKGKARNAPDNPYLFFGAGRIIKTKGLHILLKAMNKLDLNMPLVVAGDLNQTNDYKKYVLDLSKGLDVRYVGLIKKKEDLMEYIKGAKLFIFPSSYEAMSMMLLEGITTKSPTVASDIIQNKDILSEDEVLFFETNNHVDLAEKIDWALNHPTEMEKNAHKAYERFLEEYSWKAISIEYSNLYKIIS